MEETGSITSGWKQKVSCTCEQFFLGTWQASSTDTKSLTCARYLLFPPTRDGTSVMACRYDMNSTSGHRSTWLNILCNFQKKMQPLEIYCATQDGCIILACYDLQILGKILFYQVKMDITYCNIACIWVCCNNPNGQMGLWCSTTA